MTIKNSKIIEAAKTGINLEQYTFVELANSTDSKGYTALDLVARNNHLDKVQSGVTFAQLATVRDKLNLTPLHIAAGYGHFDQIDGGMTAEQLASVQIKDGFNALTVAAMNCYLGKVTGGVTFDQLVGPNMSDKYSLTSAVQSGCLDQVKNGVTAQQILSSGGPEMMRMLVWGGNLHQLRGGVTISELQVPNPGTPKRTAYQALTQMISCAEHDQVEKLANNLVGCPEAAALLNCQKVEHQQALRNAMARGADFKNILTDMELANMI